MKNKFFKKENLSFLGGIVLVSIVLIAGILVISRPHSSTNAESVNVESVSSEIIADGAIVAQDQATLHFQTAGKLTYLPFKEGDTVRQGQTIASLDPYPLQKQLQLMANSYQTATNNTDQTLENNGAGIIEGQTRYSLDTTNKNSYNSTTEAQVITDTVARIVSNNLLAQNSAQINVDIANYAISLATITSPIKGVVTHMDVTTSNVNITPTTSFTVADPSTLVFRTNILENDIDFVSVGSPVKIKLTNGLGKETTGTVIKIYPDKVTLPNGQKSYQVDIESAQITASGKMGQSGTALIQSSSQSTAKLVPTWTVLDHDSLWVFSNGKPVLRSVTVGKAHGDMTEIITGLEANDQVITNPESITARKYQIL